MAYNFDKVPNRRVAGVLNKWSFYPNDVLPMWIADMDFAAPLPILQALQKFAAHGDLGYQLPPGELYETVAERMAKLYRWKISPEMIIAIPGVNVGYNVAARTFCTERHRYLIQTPVYNEFHETEDKTGVQQAEAPLVEKVRGNRISYEVDFEAFEQAARNVDLFLLCNPHNPIGKIYSRSELKRMAEICLQNNVVIVSDEIHSELLLENNKFRPTASLGREIADCTITLVAASKAFNVPGLFCAFAIIPNAELRKRYAKTVFDMGLYVSNAGLVASRVAYSSQCDPWLNELRAYLTANRDFVVEYVNKYMPAIKVTIPDATYLAWLDCTALNLQPSPFQFFFDEAKVALSDGGKFGKASTQFVRLNFGTSRKILKDGLERMRKALQ